MCLLCPPLCLEPFLYFIGESEWVSSLCFCMKTRRHGAIWSTWFTGGTAIIHFIICVWLLTGLHRLDNYFEWNEKWNFFPPGIIPLLYIQLLWIIVLFCLSFVLMIGINQGFQGKKYINAWTWGFGAIRWFEVMLGIYILVWLGGHRIPDVVFMFPETIFVGVYWMINTLIMIWCMVTVSSYYRECYTEMYGKAKRVQFFKMLSNIRSAALSKSQSMFSGAATPRSMMMSQSTLGPGRSQASLSVASYPTKQPRSTLQSTASYAPVARGGPSAPPPGSVSEYPPPGRQGYAPPAMSGIARPPQQYPGGRPSQSSQQYPPPHSQPSYRPPPQSRGPSQSSQYPGAPQPKPRGNPAQPYFPGTKPGQGYPGAP